MVLFKAATVFQAKKLPKWVLVRNGPVPWIKKSHPAKLIGRMKPLRCLPRYSSSVVIVRVTVASPWSSVMKMFFLGMMIAYTPSLIVLAWALHKAEDLAHTAVR